MQFIRQRPIGDSLSPRQPQTTLKTSQGHLFNAGKVYVREDEVSIDLYNQLPVTARKWFAVVAWGQTVDEDIQPRIILIDADTGMAEPQSVAMRRTRYCNVNTVAGVESADPQQPSVGAQYTPVGFVLCNPTGIISVQQSLVYSSTTWRWLPPDCGRCRRGAPSWTARWQPCALTWPISPHSCCCTRR